MCQTTFRAIAKWRPEVGWGRDYARNRAGRQNGRPRTSSWLVISAHSCISWSIMLCTIGWLIYKPLNSMCVPVIVCSCVRMLACTLLYKPLNSMCVCCSLFRSSLRRRFGGESHQRGIQDMEEEHPLPLRSCDDSRTGVAQSDRTVAA